MKPFEVPTRDGCRLRWHYVRYASRGQRLR